MKSDTQSLSFGQYLKAIRLEKKISLETVSEETRIRLEMLKRIEQEVHDKLPAEVFVKGFLRAYARAIGADGDEAVQLYQSQLKAIHQLSGADSGTAKSISKLLRKLLFVAAALSAVIYMSIFGISNLYLHLSAEQAIKEQAALVKQPLKPSQLQYEAETVKESAKAVHDSLLLRVTTIEDTWMKVIIDQGDLLEYNLGPGDRLELGASSNFNLLIGNAGGVKLTLNNNPISISGKSGQIVTLQLP
jgi:cytoskeleton protein RodZ